MNLVLSAFALILLAMSTIAHLLGYKDGAIYAILVAIFVELINIRMSKEG